MNVPLLDLRLQFLSIEEELRKALDKVLSTQQFILGPEVEALEKEIAQYCRTKHAIGVASGSDALLLTAYAMGIGEGAGVLTTPFTFFSTAGSFSILGARPIFVDIEKDSFNMDPERLAGVLEKGLPTGVEPKIIVPVHLFGRCADMEKILKIAERYRLEVIEDAAQAIGAEYKFSNGTIKRAGSMGKAGILSFFPTKNLGGWGDGGMILTDDDELAEKLKMLRVHGAKPKYHHQEIGMNSRLDALQAAVLRVKLKYLDKWHEMRRQNADKYRNAFKERAKILKNKAVPPPIPPGDGEKGYRAHIYNQFVIRADRRDSLREYLTKRGVGTEVYYPLPLHLQKCYKHLGYKEGDFPIAEKAAKEALALPIYPELKQHQIDYVVDRIASFYSPSAAEG